jgi:hypothetical protein
VNSKVATPQQSSNRGNRYRERIIVGAKRNLVV